MNDNKNNGNKTAGGITFCGLLTICFIVLKLLKVISWSWLMVLSPLWIPTLILCVVIIAVILMTR